MPQLDDDVLEHVDMQLTTDEAKPVSVNTHIYDQIKAHILSNHFRPGNKLVHQDLAEMFKVSRTPIREALERLYQECFVVHYPRRGFYVAEIDAEEARQLFGVREALEMYAFRLSVENGVKFDLAKLKRINKNYQNAVEESHTKNRMVLDREFHIELAAHCDNACLIKDLERIFERIIMKLRGDSYLIFRGIEAHKEHLELLRVTSRKEYGKAEQLLSAHIRAGLARLLEQLD